MKTDEERSLAARFAGQAPEPLDGNWDDVLDRAGAARNGRRAVERPRRRSRGRRRRLLAFAGVALAVVVVSASAFGTVRELLMGSGGNRFDAPQWFPDGRRVAFIRWQWGDHGVVTEVYVMNADGTDRRNLSEEWGREPDIFPIWSPDRRRIAFVTNRCRAVVGRCIGLDLIHVMNADGSGLIRLARGGTLRKAFPGQPIGPPVPTPVWSPDGRKIAFGSDRDGHVDVYVVNADGSGQRRLTRSRAVESSLAWSPDGRRIAYVRRVQGPGVRYRGVLYPGRLEPGAIYLMNADGSGQHRLTRGRSPAWSPDGRQVAFESNGRSDIYVIDLRGTGLWRLTRNVASDARPIWSPDGRTIAFVRWRHGNSDIYVVDRDGTGERNLTPDVRPPRRAEDGSPAWSPDGGKIVFVTNRDGNGQIYVMNADGSGQRRLTRNGG